MFNTVNVMFSASFDISDNRKTVKDNEALNYSFDTLITLVWKTFDLKQIWLQVNFHLTLVASHFSLLSEGKRPKEIAN